MIARSIAFALISLASGVLRAQTVDRPSLKEGDKWAYSVRVDVNNAGALSSTTRKWESSIVRSGLQTIILAQKPMDSNLPPNEISFNADWSMTTNLNGKNAITSKPFDFPMKEGRTWKFEKVEEKVDSQIKIRRTTLKYTVVGWVDVKVPAGEFKALKIEAEGEWEKEFEMRGASTNSVISTSGIGAAVAVQSTTPFIPPATSGRLYKAYWYVPAVKRFVKSIDEDMNSSGALHQRSTQELESFSVQ